MAILDVRRKSILDQLGMNDSVSPLDPYLMGGGQDTGPFISPTQPSIPQGMLGMAPDPVGEPANKFKNLMEQVNSAYTPETQDTERFRALLDQFPQREEPSAGRRLVASGMGLDARQRVGTPGQEFTARGNAIPTMEAVLQQPHLQQLSDWKEKAQPYYNAANLERQSNVQERQLVSNAIQAETQRESIASRERIAEERNRIAEIVANASMLRAQGWTFDLKGPTIIMKQGSTGEVRDTKIPTGQLSATERIRLESEADIREIRERNAGAADVARIRGTDAEDVARIRGDFAKDLANIRQWEFLRDAFGKLHRGNPALPGETPEGTFPPTGRTGGTGTGTKAANQAEIDKQQQDALETLAATPEGRKFVKYKAGRGYYMEPPAELSTFQRLRGNRDIDAEMAQYTALYKQVYGVEPGQKPAPAATQPPGRMHNEQGQYTGPSKPNLVQQGDQLLLPGASSQPQTPQTQVNPRVAEIEAQMRALQAPSAAPAAPELGDIQGSSVYAYDTQTKQKRWVTKDEFGAGMNTGRYQISGNFPDNPAPAAPSNMQQRFGNRQPTWIDAPAAAVGGALRGQPGITDPRAQQRQAMTPEAQKAAQIQALEEELRKLQQAPQQGQQVTLSSGKTVTIIP